MLLMYCILGRPLLLIPGIKNMLYTSLILSNINHCIVVLGYKGLNIPKKPGRIITLSGYSSHSEPHLKQLNMLLKIADQLRLHELTVYFKYINKNLHIY